jgi:MFS family permease
MLRTITAMAPRQRRNLLLLSTCLALQMSGNTLIIASTALVGAVLAPDKSLATLPLALQFLATMLATIPASLLMGRIGRKPGFIIGAMLAALSGIIAVVAITSGLFALYCAAAVGIGIFNGFAVYYRFAAVEVVDEAHKSQAISLVLAGGVLAAIIGPNIANWSRDLLSGADFAGGYVAITAFYLLSMLLLALIDFPTVAQQATRGGRALSAIARQPRYLVAVLNGMLGYGVMSLVMTATPLAMQHHAHPFHDTAFVIQWHVLGMFAPSFFTGYLIRLFGLNNVMLSGGLLGIACVVINLLGHSVWHFWIALVCLGVSWNFLFVGATELLTECYQPEEKARAQALNDFLVFTTVTLASLTAGYLQHRFGWQMVNLGVLPLLAIIVGSLLWLRLHQRGGREVT